MREGGRVGGLWQHMTQSGRLGRVDNASSWNRVLKVKKELAK